MKNEFKPMKIDEKLLKSWKIVENRYKYLKSFKKYMKINEHP